VNTKTKNYKIKEFPSKGKRSFMNLLNRIKIPEIQSLIDMKILETNDLKIEIEDHYSYQKLKFQSPTNFDLPILNCSELVITYPFGAQNSSENSGHSHRLYWIDKKIVISHIGCPYYTRNGNILMIHVPQGIHEFGIGYANSLKKAYQIAWDFFYPPLKMRIPEPLYDSKSILPTFYNDYIPTSIRKTSMGMIFRGFCIGKSPLLVTNSLPVDLNDNHLRTIKKETKLSKKWRILSYLIPKS
jgi:hypothetical protein